MRLIGLSLLVGCTSTERTIGDFQVELDLSNGRFDITHIVRGPVLEDVELVGGSGSAEIEALYGAFRFTDVTADLRSASHFQASSRKVVPLVVEVKGEDGEALGTLTIGPEDANALALVWATADLEAGDDSRLGFSAACNSGEPFVGLGAHALDTNHAGESFALWVSEPGIGHVDGDEPPADWYVTGTRHSSSFPVPFLLRPDRSQGLGIDVSGRVEVDLCASDPDRFGFVAWSEPSVTVHLLTGDRPLDVVQSLSSRWGRPALPPPWVFSPWVDTIRGAERVREVAAKLRAAHIPASAIWTEDWRGGEDGADGYHPKAQWGLDPGLYPDAAALADELDADGFRWLAYYAPFVTQGTEDWDAAIAEDALVHGEDGTPVTFTGPDFRTAGLVDPNRAAGQDFAATRMADAIALGFDGWMADYGEWLPTDARTAGETGMLAHNDYPAAWQGLSAAALAETDDGAFFARSGWRGHAETVPVYWVGDQRTSFDPDDGLPSVLPLLLGLSASGVLLTTHDVAGYQSVGNPPSTEELWHRWASLGAYSPIFRTHHGAYDEGCWQFDQDAATLARFGELAEQHTRLFPYLYGLAAEAANDGTPTVLPLAMVLPGADWGRTDAFMLGDALLVAPVLEAGATGRQVDLPDDARFFDWFTREPAESGFKDADLQEIPVFAVDGRIIPTLPEAPETLVDWPTGDDARILYVFGAGGTFTEADGTTYEVQGEPTSAAEATASFDSGSIDAGGATVVVTGSRTRSYQVVVTP